MVATVLDGDCGYSLRYSVFSGHRCGRGYRFVGSGTGHYVGVGDVLVFLVPTLVIAEFMVPPVFIFAAGVWC